GGAVGLFVSAAAAPGLSRLSLHDALPIYTGHVSLETVPVDRAVEDEGRYDPVLPQARHEGGRFPMAVGNGGPQALPSGCPAARADRKSTRLNSSHVENSYAVFCLKKKKTS